MAASDPPRVAPSLNAETLSLPLNAAGERIVLAEPLGAGPINDRLTSAREGVCCVTVAVADLAATRAYLEKNGVMCEQWDNGLLVPAAATGGAPIAFVSET